MDIVIDYQKGKFVITCPIHRSDKIRTLPDRRWNPRKLQWLASTCRKNIEALQQIEGAFFSDGASQIIKQVSNQYRALFEKRAQFPPRWCYRTKPFGHQTQGLDRLFGLQAGALCMDMGTGKTKLMIDMLAAYYQEGLISTVVVVVPTSIKYNWVDELQIHCPIPTSSFILQPNNHRQFKEWIGTKKGFSWLFVGVEALQGGKTPALVEEFVRRQEKAGLAMVVDESSRIKSHKALRAKNCVNLGAYAKFRYIMTGTPISQGPVDLFMQYQFLQPHIIGLGNFYAFRDRYCVMGGYENRQIIGYKNLAELTEAIAPFTFQVRKVDVLKEIPPKIFVKRVVTMNPQQKKLYQQVAKDGLYLAGGAEQTVANTLEKMLRLQEITGGFTSYEVPNPNYDGSEKGKSTFTRKERIPGKNPKIEELLAIIEENPNKQVIIWAIYREEIAMITEVLGEKFGSEQVEQIHGGVSREQRHHDLNQLFQKGLARFLVGNQATAGMGLNMTAAEIAVYYSNSFKYEDRAQSEDRPHRSGQTKQVIYVDLVAEKSADITIHKALSQKKNISEFIRGSLSENLLVGES